jgi:hypothetical protein
MNNRYIEVDSTYRNRKLWPLSSEFEILISESGRKGKDQALDPVSFESPIHAWSSNMFSTIVIPDKIYDTNINNFVYCDQFIFTLKDNTNTQVYSITITIPHGTYNLLDLQNKINILIYNEVILNNYQFLTRFEFIPNIDKLNIIGNVYNTNNTNAIGYTIYIDFTNKLTIFQILGFGNNIYPLPATTTITSPYKSPAANLNSIIATADLLNNISKTMDDNVIILKSIKNATLINGYTTNNFTICNIQKFINYYLKATLKIENQDNTFQHISINYFKYLGTYSEGSNSNEISYDRFMIKLNNPILIDIDVNTIFTISDPTDLTDKNFLLLFVPYGRLGQNSYPNDILYNDTRNEYRNITRYDENTHMLYVQTNNAINNSWLPSDNYSIRMKNPQIYGHVLQYQYPLVYVDIDLTLFKYELDTPNEYYKNLFIRIADGLAKNQIRRIKSYDELNNAITIDYEFSGLYDQDQFEILQFSRDNAVPFVYSGSLVSQQNEVCYEISLLNLRLPNTTLNVGQGSRIAFYPYVYVELSNVSSAGRGLTNIIYSNNPNSTKMLFRASVSDTTEPIKSTYVLLNGDGAVQTVKFKPNDNLKFSVRMPNGELYQVYQSEEQIKLDGSPYIPNLDNNQISALFSIKRV